MSGLVLTLGVGKRETQFNPFDTSTHAVMFLPYTVIRPDPFAPG
jgi:hypothetical protein